MPYPVLDFLQKQYNNFLKKSSKSSTITWKQLEDQGCFSLEGVPPAQKDNFVSKAQINFLFSDAIGYIFHNDATNPFYEFYKEQADFYKNNGAKCIAMYGIIVEFNGQYDMLFSKGFFEQLSTDKQKIIAELCDGKSYIDPSGEGDYVELVATELPRLNSDL